MVEPLMDNEIREKMSELKGWHLSNGSMEKTWEFPSFKNAVSFVNRVADCAEDMDHHPDIVVNYTRVTLKLSTHSAGGITLKDFTLAKKIEGIRDVH